jgi:C-8 sterol isomerase
MDPKAAVAQGDRAFEDSWVLEYARGPIPLMLPFGLRDTRFGTPDFVTLGKTLWQYGTRDAGRLSKGKA